MRFSFKKSILPVFLAVAFLLTSTNLLFAQTPDYFAVGLFSDIYGCDLSNIKLDIYESTLDSYDTVADAYVYAHSYSHSVCTNSDGAVTFVKPSAYFLVMVDLTTLPSDVGIDKELVFYHNASQKNDSRALSAIADFEIIYDQSAESGIGVNIFNARGETIKADYTVTPNVVSNAKALVLADTYQTSGYVTVGGIVKYYDYVVEDTSDPIDRISKALESNRISREDALDLYLELWESEYSYGFCGTSLLMQIQSLSADKAFVSQLSKAKQKALASIAATPSYIDERIFEGSFGYGYLDIHYEGDGISGWSTPSAIYDIYDAFSSTYSLFISGTFWFQEPATYTIWLPVFDVYVVDEPGTGWLGATYSQPNGYYDGTSYIVLNLAKLDMNDLYASITAKAETTIAHEYMHAIMNSYRNLGYFELWFVESLPSWAMIRQYGSAGSQVLTGHINDFLTYSWRPLNSSFADPYGAVLLPLYIHAYCGGDITIERIIKRTAVTTDQFAAIEYGLSFGLYTKTFDALIQKFWIANYSVFDNYTAYAVLGWNTEAHISGYYPYDALPNYAGPYNANVLSCQYRQFELDTNLFVWDATVSVTVNIVHGPSSAYSVGAVILSDGFNINVSVGLPFYTIIYSWNWDGDVEGCVIVGNLNRSLMVGLYEYYLTVDVLYG